MVRSLLRRTGLSLGICALSIAAAPGLASGASWGSIPSTHPLVATDFGVSIHTAVGPLGFSCASSQFDADVRDAARLTVTTASFVRCSGIQLSLGCTATVSATALDWTATGLTTSNVTIDGVRMDFVPETKPGSMDCFPNGLSFSLTGNIVGGLWSAAAHAVTFINSTGLISHSALGTNVATVSGTLRDVTGMLTLT